jgi:glycosyltransferase involved in cell wall biosynthesis
MNKRTSICILLPDHFSANMGGAEQQAGTLADALARTNKYNIIYLCDRADENYKPKGYEIRLIGKDRVPGKWSPFSTAQILFSELKKIHPAIIYQNVGGIQTGVAAFYAKKHGARFIWHIASDDDVSLQWKNDIKRAILTVPERLFLNYGIRNSDVIAAQTRHQAKLLKHNFGIKCHNFIPIGHPLAEEKLDKPEDRVSIVWVANMKPLKRPEVFIRLAEQFSSRTDVYFTMIGRPGWGSWYKKLSSDIKKLANLEYAGKLTQDEVNRYICNSHILVNTSRYEGFSNTFVQAWMRKVAVVSLSVDPDSILVKENIGFRSGTFSALCTDVNSLITNKQLRENMGDKAFNYARKHHSVDSMVSKAMTLFKN